MLELKVVIEMSKLRDNPAKEIPKRVLLIAPAVTLLIFAATFVVEIDFLLVAGWFWLGTLSNLACFWLIVKGSALMIKKQEAGEKASIMPNTMLRFAIYAVTLFIAAQVGMTAFVATIVGILMVKIAITTDGMFF